jgi:hypothetical protein
MLFLGEREEKERKKNMRNTNFVVFLNLRFFCFEVLYYASDEKTKLAVRELSINGRTVV